MLLQLPALIRHVAQLVGQFGLLFRELRLGLVEITSPCGKLASFFLHLLHLLFGHAQPLEALERRFDFLLAVPELSLRRVDLRFARAHRSQLLAHLGPLDFQLAGPLAERVGLLLQLAALRLQSRFPFGDLRFATLDLRDAIVDARLVGRERLDVAIQLRLTLIQFAVPRFDRRFALLQPLVPLVPVGAILIHVRQAVAQIGFAPLNLGQSCGQPALTLGERFLADLGQFRRAGFGGRFALGEFLLARQTDSARSSSSCCRSPSHGRSSPTWLRGRPLARPTPLATIERALLRLQSIGQLGRVLAQLLQRVFARPQLTCEAASANDAPTTCSGPSRRRRAWLTATWRCG